VYTATGRSLYVIMRNVMTLKTFIGKYPLRIFHQLLQIYWFLFRPKKMGAKVVVICNDNILLVKHTFNPSYWTLPGGGVKRGEEPINAARRELKEEIGRNVDNLEFLRIVHNKSQYKEDTIYTYYTKFEDKNIIKDDLEILEARWFPVNQLPEVNPVLRTTLLYAIKYARKSA